jgi:DNA-binding MarR family transcriptional regulator
MGLTRQSVQASVNRLAADELVEARENPDHRRSPLVRLTPRGTAAYRRLERRQARWADALAADLGRGDLETAARVLEQFCARLEDDDATGGRET